MRKFIAAALIAMQTVLTCACAGGNTDTVVTQKTTQTAAPAQKAEIKKISDLAKLDEVESIKRGSFPYAGISLFKMTFVSEGISVRADIILPEGYENGGMPLMIYTPNGYTVDTVKSLCDAGICVVRLYYRGADGSEGKRDLGGEDWKDAANVTEILKKADFWNESKVIFAGSSPGSVTALRTAAERPELIDACAVIDVVSDVGAFVEAKGEGVKKTVDGMIGETDDLIGEYAKRSAVNFADKIKCRTLVVSYKDSPYNPEEQSFTLVDAMTKAGNAPEHYRANAYSADIQGSALHKLILFIRSVNGETPEKGGAKFTFKNGADEAEQKAVVAEAEKIMSEINAYLGISIADGIKVNCIFDPAYVNANGEIRSQCVYREKIIYCVKYEDFVHEYAHMLLWFCEGGVYTSGDARFSEGAAMYICNLWETEINDTEYVYFKETGVRKWGNAAEHEMILELMNKKELAYNNLNYNNATLAMTCREAGIDMVLQSKNTEFVNYYLGFTVVDYLIKECGGMEKFIAFYQDRASVSMFYGKSVNEISRAALEWNGQNFGV